MATDVTPAAVEAAFTHASQVDIHLDPAMFADLVRVHEREVSPVAAHTGTAPRAGLEVQL